MAQCRQDLTAADTDFDDRITIEEYVTFIELMGLRVCYDRGDGLPSPTEEDVFDVLVCLTSDPCVGVTEIVVDDDTLTPILTFDLCTSTYFLAMGAPTCESTNTTAAPTISHVTAAPQGSGAADHWRRYQMALVAGAATLLVSMWI